MKEKVSIYFPPFQQSNRLIFEIATWTEGQELALSDLAREDFVRVNDPKEADWIVLPIFLTGLNDPKGKKLIQESHQIARKAGKNLAFFSNSDLLIDPQVEDYYLFTPGSYRSDWRQIELPALLSIDPLKAFYQGKVDPITKITQPTVGFCGQASKNILKTVKDYFFLQRLRLKRAQKKIPYQKIPMFLPALERHKLLTALQNSSQINTDFILRSKYGGGAKTPDEKSILEREFYQNIRNNLFTICLRGLGNYSVRFYQTLAMGRIPVLIDTDSAVPFINQMEGSDFFIRIPYEQQAEIPKILVEFVAEKTPEQLHDYQMRCRQIWENHYQKDAMMGQLAKELKALRAGNPRKTHR